MTKIIIKDLPMNTKLDEKELKKAYGGSRPLPMPPTLPFFDSVSMSSDAGMIPFINKKG